MAGPDIPVLSYSAPIMSVREGAVYPEVSANKAAVLSLSDRVFLFKKDADKQQPIASITKLMTALVFLEHNPGWETVYTVSEVDKIEGGHLNLFLGDKVKISDLFKTSLIASDNGATIGLVHASGLSEKEFVAEMNRKAELLGLKKTSFSDPIGLSDNNVSTASEVAVMARAALSQPEIREVVVMPNYSYSTIQGREKVIESTDYLLFTEDAGGIMAAGGKTGYTDSAGYCFVGKFKNEKGAELISVVLGSDGKNSRFKESRDLVISAIKNYEISR